MTPNSPSDEEERAFQLHQWLFVACAVLMFSVVILIELELYLFALGATVLTLILYLVAEHLIRKAAP